MIAEWVFPPLLVAGFFCYNLFMTNKYGILAYPAKHSLSPMIHNAAFKEMNIDAEYGVFEIDSMGLQDFMDYVKAEPISGLSVSLPHKVDIMQYMHVIDDDAKKIGAVNTVLNNRGTLYGYNTDFIGSNLALGEIKAKKFAVLGTGGAARAIVYGILKEGGEVTIYSRSLDKAKKLADEFGASFGDFSDIDGGDVLIQATSIWITSPESTEIVPAEIVKKFDTVMDIIYKPLMTPLLKMAQDLGKNIITGEKMFLYQAVKQFEIWTDQKAPTSLMQGLLDKNL